MSTYTSSSDSSCSAFMPSERLPLNLSSFSLLLLLRSRDPERAGCLRPSLPRSKDLKQHQCKQNNYSRFKLFRELSVPGLKNDYAIGKWRDSGRAPPSGKRRSAGASPGGTARPPSVAQRRIRPTVTGCIITGPHPIGNTDTLSEGRTIQSEEK